MTTEYKGAFDLIFIDADKANAPEYFRRALALSRPGTVILVDNVVRKGEIANGESTDPNVQGMRRLIEMVAAESRVAATAIQTLALKGTTGLSSLVFVHKSARIQAAPHSWNEQPILSFPDSSAKWRRAGSALQTKAPMNELATAFKARARASTDSDSTDHRTL